MPSSTNSTISGESETTGTTQKGRRTDAHIFRRGTNRFPVSGQEHKKRTKGERLHGRRNTKTEEGTITGRWSTDDPAHIVDTPKKPRPSVGENAWSEDLKAELETLENERTNDEHREERN